VAIAGDREIQCPSEFTAALRKPALSCHYHNNQRIAQYDLASVAGSQE
jgi:hypothetical protein